MSRRRAWLFWTDRHLAGKPSIPRNRHFGGRPGLIYRYTYRAIQAMDPEKLAKGGSEHSHQRAFMQALLTWAPTIHAVTFAIPNGAALAERSKSPQGRLTGAIRMNKLKAEGLKPGVPDIFVAWPQFVYATHLQYNGLFLEFKVADKGVIGPDQKMWRARLQERGYSVRTVFNFKEGINAVARYFGQPAVYADVGDGC